MPLVLDPKVFKAYDIRGIHPTELDEDGAYRIGRAYVEHFEPRTVAVGRDMRLSSPSMAAALIEGAADGGADVLDLGMIGTEMLYYAVGELGLEGGVCVTASHNPKEYSGMKIVRRGALPVGGDSGLEDVRRPCRGDVRRSRAARRGSLRGRLGRVRRQGALVRRPAGDPAAQGRDRRGERHGGGDAAAGARTAPPAGRRAVLLRAGRVVPEPRAEPAAPREPRVRRREDPSEGADLGVAYDGDADRCFFVDDTGEFVPGDFVTALLARAMLAKEPGAKIIYDVRASWAVPRAIEEAGGLPLVNRVGHAFIKHRMRKENALFAGEVSAHYYFRDFSQADTGVVPFLVMLEILSESGQPLSELLAPFRDRYFITGEINTPVADVALKLQELKERYTAEGGRVSHLDGISVDFDDWHFNVRPSNTEPLLRLNLEALDPETMERRRDEVLELIRS